MTSEIKTYMLFNLVFTNNTILLCFLFFFLIIDLYSSISPVVAHILIPTGELVTPTEIPTNEAKEEIETHPVTAESKISKFVIWFKTIFIHYGFIHE